MVEFLQAAYPWIAGGLAIAIILAYGNSRKKKQDNKE